MTTFPSPSEKVPEGRMVPPKKTKWSLLRTTNFEPMKTLKVGIYLFAVATTALNASGLFSAKSARTLRFNSMFAEASLLINLE